MATLKMDYDLADCSNLAADATAYIKKKEGRFFKAGGLWIYDNEIENVTGNSKMVTSSVSEILISSSSDTASSV